MLWNDLKGVASRWRELGIQLDLDDGELNAISADDSGVAACMRRVLNEWMAAETDDGERKRQIVAALSSPCLGETRLARQLDRGGFVFNSCSGQYTIVLSEQGTVPTLMLPPRHSVHCMHAIVQYALHMTVGNLLEVKCIKTALVVGEDFTFTKST